MLTVRLTGWRTGGQENKGQDGGVKADMAVDDPGKRVLLVQALVGRDAFPEAADIAFDGLLGSYPYEPAAGACFDDLRVA